MIHIFSIYMILLALVPCADGNGGIIEIVNHMAGIEHTEFEAHADHGNSCEDDYCSPFCICSCCSLAIEIPTDQSLAILMPKLTPTDAPTHYVNIIRSSYKFSIWQPPRLS